MALLFGRRNTPTPPQPQANQANAGGASTPPPPQASQVSAGGASTLPQPQVDAKLKRLGGQLEALEDTLDDNLVKARGTLSSHNYTTEAETFGNAATLPADREEALRTIKGTAKTERETARTALKSAPEWNAREATKTALDKAKGRKLALEELIQENTGTRFGKFKNRLGSLPGVGTHRRNLAELDREIRVAQKADDLASAALEATDQHRDFIASAKKKIAVGEGVNPYMENLDAIKQKTQDIERLKPPVAAPAAEPVAAVETAAAEVPAAKSLTRRQLKQQLRELGHDIQKAERQAVGDIAAGHFGGARKAVEKAQDLITAGKFDEAQALFKRAKGLQLEGAGLINEMKPVTRLGKAWHFTKGAGKWGAIGTGVAAGAGLLYAALKPSERSSDDGAMQDLSHRMAENDARMQALQSMTPPPAMPPQVVMVPAPQSGFVGRLEAERGAPVMAYADPAARPQPRVLDAQSQGGQWVVPPQQAVQVVGA